MSDDAYEQRHNFASDATVLLYFFHVVYRLLDKFFMGNRGNNIAFGAKWEYLRLSFVGQAAR